MYLNMNPWSIKKKLWKITPLRLSTTSVSFKMCAPRSFPCLLPSEINEKLERKSFLRITKFLNFLKPSYLFNKIDPEKMSSKWRIVNT